MPKKKDDAVPTVSGHRFVPKHELLSKEEAAKVFEQFHATPSQFPFILSTDPAAREVGAVPGDLVKITRKSDTAGESFYYRYVVEP